MSEPINLEEAAKSIFGSSASAGGDEEILKVASEYALQLPGDQMKLLLHLEDLAIRIENLAPISSQRIQHFCTRWLELKKYNNSAGFVQKVLDSISLAKWIKAGMIDINVQKK